MEQIDEEDQPQRDRLVIRSAAPEHVSKSTLNMMERKDAQFGLATMCWFRVRHRHVLERV